MTRSPFLLLLLLAACRPQPAQPELDAWPETPLLTGAAHPARLGNGSPDLALADWFGPGFEADSVHLPEGFLGRATRTRVGLTAGKGSPPVGRLTVFKDGFGYVIPVLRSPARAVELAYRPKDGSEASKLLPRGTSMKVISSTDSYLKVELDSGEVGYVPMVMVEDPNAAATLPYGTNPGEIQVYPPLGGYGEPLPPVAPGEMPPDGAIPTVIDPDAPAPVVPVPAATTPGEDFTAPAVPSGPAPLPPNDEDLERMRNAPQDGQPAVPDSEETPPAGEP